MGRKKQGASKSAKSPEVSAGLGHAWSSSPTRPPKYSLHCVNHENDRRYIVNSYGLYAIRKLFDAIVGENEVEPSPLDEDTVTFGEIDIKSDQLKEILDHEYSKAEEAWELPQPYPGEVNAFLTGGRIAKGVVDPDAPKATRAPKEPKEPRAPKVDRSQFITVQSIAEELKMDPRDARAALRKAKVEKPVGGWLGDDAWAKDIREILSKAARK